jgi:hypothetical protein
MKPWLISAFLLCVACGRADTGESCDKVGDTDECVDEAICTNESNGSQTCRKRCTEDTQCASSEQCNGVSGTNIKSCQPKDSK